MNIRKSCPYCGRTYTPYRRKQKACSRPDCQRQRAKEARLERKARGSEAVMLEAEQWARKMRTRRLYDRGKRDERKEARNG